MLVALAALLLAACGGGHGSTSSSSAQNASDTSQSTSSEEAVVARVGTVPITRAQVNHWMHSLGGSAYYYVSHSLTVPEDLVSDPPNYGRCVSTLEAVAARSPLGHARENASELLTKCHELNEAFRINALNYLLNTEREIQIGAQEGVVATPQQTQRFFQQLKHREYPTETALRTYLESRRVSLSDLLLEAKLDLISKGLTKKIDNAQEGARFEKLEKQMVAKTTCEPGYVVEGCSEFTGNTRYPNLTAPSALMEQVSAIVTDTCIDLRGCGKQIGK